MRESALSWVEFAIRDLQGAKELLNNENLANLVMFHSQQCIEKLLKAIMEEHVICIPKIHKLLRLYSLLPKDITEKLLIEEDELNRIDQIYIDSRYPADFGLLPSGVPTQKEAEQIFAIAERITRNFIKLFDIKSNILTCAYPDSHNHSVPQHPERDL